MKYKERLPHRKVCESLDRTYGLRVTPATVLDITRRVSGWLRSEYEGILHRIRSARAKFFDTTVEDVFIYQESQMTKRHQVSSKF